MASIQLVGFVLLFYVSIDNSAVSFRCGNNLCGYGTRQKDCSYDVRGRCLCRQGYLGLHNLESYPDVSVCDEYCGPRNYVCPVNYKCVFYNSWYVCRCSEGFHRSPKGNCVVDSITDPNDGAWIGMYVGVTLGIIVLLVVVVVAAIFIRRRRKSRKPVEGKAELPQRHSDDETNHPQSPSNSRQDKTVSVEYSNVKIPKLDRRQSDISVEYSNEKILPKSDRDDNKDGSIQSEGQDVYSARYEEHVHIYQNFA